MADLCTGKLNRLKLWQIGLSAVTSSGLLSVIFIDSIWLKIGTAVVSLISLYVNAYMKSFDLGEVAQKHRNAAQKIWGVRESYLSLLTDLRMVAINDDQARIRRDELQKQLGQIYVGAPQTNFEAYISAQKALKELEDYTFSDDELDEFVPLSLKKSK